MSLLDRDKAALVVIDIQEGFRSYASFDSVAASAHKLVQAARILGLPILISEQYPKGLGHTAPEVGLAGPARRGDVSEVEGDESEFEPAGAAPEATASEATAPEDGTPEVRLIEKTVFSAARADGFDLEGRGQAIVCGIETHVCVSQTVHDLLDEGLEVHVPADAVGSRYELDYFRGLERLERAGAVVSTVESALFELLGRAGTPEFKTVQKLII
jgi:nicotinamidase-related amidase